MEQFRRATVRGLSVFPVVQGSAALQVINYKAKQLIQLNISYALDTHAYARAASTSWTDVRCAGDPSRVTFASAVRSTCRYSRRAPKRPRPTTVPSTTGWTAGTIG